MSLNPPIEVAPGWHRHLSNHDYHASNGASSSVLKKFLEETPFKIEYQRLYSERKHNPVFDLGTAVHTLVLEPEKFAASVAIPPDWNLHTKAGRAEKEIFLAENAGKAVITAEQYEAARAMAHELLSHRVASQLLDDCFVEQSIYWLEADEKTGIEQLLKVRPDALSKKLPLVLDVKTCENASYDAMRSAITKYRYNLSAAMYLYGVNQCAELLEAAGIPEYQGFCLLCVESKPPYQVACYEIGGDLLDFGRSDFRVALTRLFDANIFGCKGYPDVLRVIDAPKWNPAPAIL